MNKTESQPGMEPMDNDAEVVDETEENIPADLEKGLSSDTIEGLEEIYDVIKKKFNDPEAGWTPAKLAANSTEKLAPIIEDFRQQLGAGGAAKPDNILQAIIDLAIEMSKKGQTKEEFVDSTTNLEKVVPGSKFSDFYKFMSMAEQKETPVE